jgi:hypothetical protein
MTRTFFCFLALMGVGAGSSCAHQRKAPARSSEAAPLGQFPKAISIKTPTRTFNMFFYYALDALGRIWVKSIPGASSETEGVAPDWELLFGTGLPHDVEKENFVVPKRIETINADQDELMVVSDDKRHYSMRWFENPVFKEETPAQVWSDVHGWPVSGALVWNARVAGNRGWAVGRRTRTYLLFEDLVGRTFDGGGGLSSYYFLSRKGTDIVFSDSGLPADFSHTICGPERSTFVSERLQVDGDTLFVINAYGEMRTRTFDFDTNGADTMFFTYTYDRKDPRPDAIAIPAENWFSHKPIPLVGRAQISTNITLVRTGKHNRDRELRVAGYDAQRTPGYFFKRIFTQDENSPARHDSDEWKFKADDSVPLDLETLLDPAVTDPDEQRSKQRSVVVVAARFSEQKPERRVAHGDVVFKGTFKAGGKVVEATVQVPDFNFACTPATVRLSTAQGEPVDLILHTVENWYHLMRFDPGHDGTPIEYQATLEIPDDAFATANTVLKELLEKTLKPYHLKAFALLAQATDDYLEIEAKEEHAPSLGHFTWALTREGAGHASIDAAKAKSLRRDVVIRTLDEPRFVVTRPLTELTRADLKMLRERLEALLRVDGELRALANAPQKEDDERPSWLSPTVLGILSLATDPPLINVIVPFLPFRNVPIEEASYYARNLTTNMPPMLRRSAKLREMISRYLHEDLDRALNVLAHRIEAYRQRLYALECE